MTEHTPESINLPWLEQTDAVEAKPRHPFGASTPVLAIGALLAAALIGAAFFTVGSRREGAFPMPALSQAPFEPAIQAPVKSPDAVVARSPAPSAPTPPAGPAVEPKEDRPERVTQARREEPKIAPIPSAVPTRQSSKAEISREETIQLAAYSKATGAEAGWRRLRRAHPELRALDHQVIRARVNSRIVYRLRATGSTAYGVCDDLSKAGTACMRVADR